MPRLHALELTPDRAGEDAVERDWQVLRDLGLPSQLDHSGGTNTPHVTLVALPSIDDDLERQAVDCLRDALPTVVRVSGVAVLGGQKLTLARLLDVPPALTRAVLELRAGLRDERHPGWLPHVTLCRRLPRSEVQRALDALGYDDLSLTLTGLRRWDPERGEVRRLV